MSIDYRFAPSAAEDAPPGEEAGNEAIETRLQEVGEPQHGARLDKFLVGVAPEFSRNHLQSLIGDGRVHVDGLVATSASRRLRCGQRVEIELWPTQESRAFRAEPMDLRILYEDEELLVVDKPAGLVVHPAAGHWSHTLLNGLLAHHGAAATLPRAGIVHRLDKDTSGLMVVGKTLVAVTALSRAIAARAVGREYLAIVHGELAADSMTIEAPIGRDMASRVRMAVVGGGRAARTDVTRIAIGLGCSAVRCRLHTGRTHQIRVHLASRSHPLVGDALYGGTAVLGLDRQALHATRLTFEHPLRGTPLQLDAPPPGDFGAAWARILGAA